MKERTEKKQDKSYTRTDVNELLGDLADRHGLIIGDRELIIPGPAMDYTGTDKEKATLKYEDVARIIPCRSSVRILLWNGYLYTLCGDSDRKMCSFTHTEDVLNLLNNEITPGLISQNIEKELDEILGRTEQ